MTEEGSPVNLFDGLAEHKRNEGSRHGDRKRMKKGVRCVQAKVMHSIKGHIDCEFPENER